MNRHTCNGCKYLDSSGEMMCTRYSTPVDIVVNCMVKGDKLFEDSVDDRYPIKKK